MDRNKTILLVTVVITAVIALVAVSSLLQYQDAKEVTWDDLVSIDRDSAEIAMSLDESESVCIQNVTAFTLLHSGVPQELMRNYPSDWNMMARNTGLTDGVKKDATEDATAGDLNRILNNSKPLAKAFDGGITEPFFYNGLPQPVFAYTYESDDYSNENSDTIRYCVYVETDYDTDSDGKRDLIEVFLQVPRAAMEGGYDAPVILVACPYDHGVDFKEEAEPADAYDMSRIRSQPDVRVPVGSMSAWDTAMAAVPSDWYYGDEQHEYVHQHLCDYFLPRGYAVAVCGLLGSYGSEGYACTGLDLELLAVKSVIEWFDGDAVGYTSKDSLISTEAGWCSGDVGMYGRSYLGTVQIGVAAMGIDNLKTIIPFGAISNWYEYVYQKGGLINTGTLKPYMASLAEYVSTTRDPTVGDYHRFMQKVSYDESVLLGQYSDGTSTFWTDRDYTRMDIDTETSIMLVHGINDYNVRMCGFASTKEMFKDSGVTMKVFLHQGAHQSPENLFVFNLGETDGMVTINKWLSHYLFGQNTGVEKWPDIQVQSNLDGSWSAYDSLDPSAVASYRSSETGTDTFCSDTEGDIGFEIELMTADRDMTILGGELRLSLTSETAGIPDQPVSIIVYDRYGPGMKAFHNSDYSQVDTRFVAWGDPEKGEVWFGSTVQNVWLSEFELQDTTSREITMGAVGLGYYGETVDLE
jgi:X-Pro dipeptidyl-peptidase